MGCWDPPGRAGTLGLEGTASRADPEEPKNSAVPLDKLILLQLPKIRLRGKWNTFGRYL